MNIEFLSTVAVNTPDPPASRKLYLDTIGLPLGGDEDLHSEQVAGCKCFGIWPLPQAAEACLGTPQWPADRPTPQISIEFDVTDRSCQLSGTRAPASGLRAVASTARSRGGRR